MHANDVWVVDDGWHLIAPTVRTYNIMISVINSRHRITVSIYGSVAVSSGFYLFYTTFLLTRWGYKRRVALEVMTDATATYDDWRFSMRSIWYDLKIFDNNRLSLKSAITARNL